MNNKVYVERGNRGYSTFGGQRTAFTSLDFGQLTPLMADEVLERDSWRFNLRNKLEIAPMVCRSFNDIFYNQGAFFVGYSQLDKYFADIRSKKVYHLGSALPNLLSFETFSVFNTLFADINLKIKIDAVSDAPTSFTASMDDYESNPDQLFYNFKTTIAGAAGIQTLVTFVDTNSLDAAVNQQAIKDALHKDSGDVRIVLGYSTATTFRYGILSLTYSKRGQFFRKIFDGLGYKMPLIYIDGDSNPWAKAATLSDLYLRNWTSSGTLSAGMLKLSKGMPCAAQLNAYPLLAYLKIYNDFFCMSSVRDENPIALLLDKVYNRDVSYVNSLGVLVWGSTFQDAFLACSLQLYSDDITRSVRNFYNENNPFFTAGDPNQLQVPKVTVNTTQPGTLLINGTSKSLLRGDYSGTSGDEQVSLETTDGNKEDITTWNTKTTFVQNKLMEVAHRYLLTNRLVGSKLANRLRAFFGVTDSIDDAMRSHCVAFSRIPIQINGQLIQSNTYNGQDVDDDAGTRIGVPTASGKTSYSYTNNNLYGIGITLNWLSVRTIYSNRNPRYTLKITKEDLYDGMLDGQGFAQNIAQMEVNNDCTDNSLNYCFGQEPLYEEYRKMSVDFMSGDILRLTGMKSYLIPRDFRNIVNERELYAEFSAIRSVRQATDEFSDLWISKDGSDPVLICADVSVLATRNVQDSVHAMGLPAGDMSVELQGNIA